MVVPVQAAEGAWHEVSEGHIRTWQEQSTTLSSQCLPTAEEGTGATHSLLLLLKSKLVKPWPWKLMEDLGEELMLIYESPMYLQSEQNHFPLHPQHGQEEAAVSFPFAEIRTRGISLVSV